MALLVACLTMTGCATVLNETTQPVKVETLTATGEVVTGADCKLGNEYESVKVRSGNTADVRRSGTDLDIVCSHPDNPDAKARAVSRANSGMFGNIILGGAVGAIIDHSKGTAYTYPTWVQLVFGKTLIFDRKDEKDGQPVAGTDTGAPPSTTTSKDANPSQSPMPATAGSAKPGESRVTIDDLRGLLPPQK
ncbi:MAG: hypothetical protein KF871_06440 [Hydrogenophaga sp.]|uniref:hypothetical protein n=1 Tax=Hydrogenophaga sp. TaxID=1904254 RepID=UPI001D9F6B69|nr:hypothetical protein [Hydrogenophaga sp.]MBX3609520.1 hypothetical protein [Hydrogenophaga sp.]